MMPPKASAETSLGKLGPPTGSKVTRAPWPLVIRITSPTRSTSSVAMTCTAPASRSCCFFADDCFALGELFAEGTQGRTDPDDAPEPPAHPVAEPGDLWVLGGHRLLCGDSTVATDVARVLGGVAPHLMVTDPPYGVNYDPAWRNQAGRSINGTTRRIAAGTVIKPIGARAVGKVVNYDRADWRQAWALFQGTVDYNWHTGPSERYVQV